MDKQSITETDVKDLKQIIEELQAEGGRFMTSVGGLVETCAKANQRLKLMSNVANAEDIIVKLIAENVKLPWYAPQFIVKLVLRKLMASKGA